MKISVFATIAAMAILAGIIVFGAGSRAQTPDLDNAVKPGDSEIHRLRVADQEDRHGYMNKSKAEWAEMAKHDAVRLKRAKEIYRSGSLVTGADYFDAALILQHSNSSDDYLLGHVLCTIAIDRGVGADARWLSAATLDRYLQSIQQKQIFGTQYNGDEQKGYTNGAYDPNLLTDSVRKALEVPTIEEQKKDLEKMNKSLSASK